MIGLRITGMMDDSVSLVIVTNQWCSHDSGRIISPLEYNIVKIWHCSTIHFGQEGEKIKIGVCGIGNGVQ